MSHELSRHLLCSHFERKCEIETLLHFRIVIWIMVYRSQWEILKHLGNQWIVAPNHPLRNVFHIQQEQKFSEMQMNGCTLNGQVFVYLLVSFSVVCLLFSPQMFPLLCGQSQADHVAHDWTLTLNTSKEHVSCAATWLLMLLKKTTKVVLPLVGY